MTKPPPEEEQDFAAALAAFDREQAAQRAEQSGQKGQKEGQKSGREGARGPGVGDSVTARIVGFGEESAFVDLGGKSEGVIPLAELTDDDGQRTAAVGDTVEAKVVGIDDDAGVVLLRVRHGRGTADSAEIAQAHAHGLPVEGTVQAVVKGGVEVTVAGIRAFCPISQLDNRRVEGDGASFIGQRLSFRITRYETGRGRPNIVLSRRALLEEEARERAEAARARLKVGAVVRGTVTSLANYGAFVDLGGIEGLLHVSELGHGRVDHPKDVLTVGQEVEVQVKSIEPAPPQKDGKGGKGERISLSRRALLQDPWQEAAALLRVASRHRGRVTRLETYGAFVELSPGVEGLLHVSELEARASHALRHPRDAVKIGETLEVVVTAVELDRRRVSLTLARADDGADATGSLPAPEAGFGAMGDFFDKSKKK